MGEVLQFPRGRARRPVGFALVLDRPPRTGDTVLILGSGRTGRYVGTIFNRPGRCVVMIRGIMHSEDERLVVPIAPDPGGAGPEAA